MAASTSVLAPSNSSSALFRAWGSAVDAAFLAAGWVQTADTGQINWTTVTAPGGINTSQGYTIWGTNDGLTTVYCKIEYGSGSATNTPGFWLTLGTGTNGSGTLTGQVGTRRQVAGGGNTTTTYNCHFGGGTGWFACGMFMQTASATSYGIWFALERTLDNSGSATTDGMAMYAFGAGAAYHQTMPLSGTIWTLDSFVPCGYGRGASLVDGTTIGTMPVFPMTQVMHSASLAVVAFYYSDIPNSTTFTLSRYGSDHTYVACRPSSGATPTMLGVNASYAVALRYE